MELKRVVVTGLGAITPLGNNVPSTWAALLEGVSGAGRYRRGRTRRRKSACQYYQKKRQGNECLFSRVGR